MTREREERVSMVVVLLLAAVGVLAAGAVVLMHPEDGCGVSPTPDPKMDQKDNMKKGDR